jgi:hypothetical protein
MKHKDSIKKVLILLKIMIIINKTYQPRKKIYYNNLKNLNKIEKFNQFMN